MNSDTPWSLSRTVAPASEIVSTADAKAHLRVDHSNDDTLIAALSAASREWCENYCRRAFYTQTWRLRMDSFPDETSFLVPRSPLQSISSISYVDTAGDTQTWSSSNYIVSADMEPARVSLAYGVTWPTTRAQADAVTVTFVAGWTSTSNVPAPIVAAIKLYLGFLYESRENVVPGQMFEVPMGITTLLAPYRLVYF